MTKSADALLRTYRDKRDFAVTREPSGEAVRGSAVAGGLAFTVQKHDATRLHYDFRVEWDGVLKSWAVTRGPSLDPAEKRLAVRTEDHPLDYGDFEGTIPERQYGGGTVMLWDRGSWEPEPGTDPAEGLARGNLKMVLHGQKMQGRWALIRMKARAKEKRENWLLIKEKDATADPDGDLLALDRSVKTGRDLAAIAAGEAPGGEAPAETVGAGAGTTPAEASAGTAATPGFRPLQLATLVAEVPSGADWLHEMKYDGYRVLIAFAEGRATLWTRNEQDWTERFAALLPAIATLPCRSALIDGEVVAFGEQGRTDFSTLQKHLSEGGPLACFCFDLLELDGTDLAGEPLTERKAALKVLLGGETPGTLLFSDHIEGQGEAVFKGICEAGQEGIVSKRADAPYRPGRGTDWLKTKCTRRQEFVIGGVSPSDKRGRPFSSILVGAWEGDRLLYRGRVGSGFDEETLKDLEARFAGLATKTGSFDSLPRPIRRRARFLKPELVAEIDFAELTADGQIRHGVFKGLREDKPARSVTGETPRPPEEAPPVRKGRAKAAGDTVAGVRLTHPERVVFHGQGITKRDLALYYEALGPRILPHLSGRPVSLVRCPQGGARRCFFQKHASAGFGEAVRTLPIQEKDGGVQDYLYIESVAGLVAAVQMNALEFHIWGAHRDRLERPDRIVFDLDPDVSLGFGDAKAAAETCRNALRALGLPSFPMVTGGKGIHVVVPLTPQAQWGSVKAFARGFAEILAREEPKRFVSTMAKAKRKGLVFIDWLRNERGATAIAPYSTRSRDGAPVAVPVSWEELARLKAANGFHIADVLKLAEAPDPWEGFAAARVVLEDDVVEALTRDS